MVDSADSKGDALAPVTPAAAEADLETTKPAVEHAAPGPDSDTNNLQNATSIATPADQPDPQPATETGTGHTVTDAEPTPSTSGDAAPTPAADAEATPKQGPIKQLASKVEGAIGGFKWRGKSKQAQVSSPTAGVSQPPKPPGRKASQSSADGKEPQNADAGAGKKSTGPPKPPGTNDNKGKDDKSKKDDKGKAKDSKSGNTKK